MNDESVDTAGSVTSQPSLVAGFVTSAYADTRALEGWKPDAQEVAAFSRRHQAEQLLAEIVARVLALDAHPGDMEGHRTDAAPAR